VVWTLSSTAPTKPLSCSSPAELSTGPCTGCGRIPGASAAQHAQKILLEYHAEHHQHEHAADAQPPSAQPHPAAAAASAPVFQVRVIAR
jgi:hypothetical protein